MGKQRCALSLAFCSSFWFVLPCQWTGRTTSFWLWTMWTHEANSSSPASHLGSFSSACFANISTSIGTPMWRILLALTLTSAARPGGLGAEAVRRTLRQSEQSNESSKESCRACGLVDVERSLAIYWGIVPPVPVPGWGFWEKFSVHHFRTGCEELAHVQSSPCLLHNLSMTKWNFTVGSHGEAKPMTFS